jgi:ferredoxin
VTARYRIQVDHAVCQGSGLCVGIAPENFKIGDDFKSRPLMETVDASDNVRDAAECCPLEAITVTDADTGEPVAP